MKLCNNYAIFKYKIVKKAKDKINLSYEHEKRR